MNLLWAFYLMGAFSVVLGITHFFMPILLDFRNAIPEEGPPIKPFRIGSFTYRTQRSDLYGIAWVMNHCVSFVILTVGIVDLYVTKWISTPMAPIICTWIALWWFLRAACQFYLGKRRGDWAVFFWFAFLGVVHLYTMIN